MPQKSAMWQKSDAKNWQTLSVSVSCGIHIIKKYPALSVFPGGVVDRAPAKVEHFALGTGSIPTSGKMFFSDFFLNIDLFTGCFSIYATFTIPKLRKTRKPSTIF